MRDLIVETRNVKLLGRAIDRLLNQSRLTPHFGVIAGPVGRGKTVSAQKACLDHDAIWVEGLPDWTPRWMLGDIAVELGAGRAITKEHNFRLVAEALQERKRAIFIDEADCLVRHLGLLETLTRLGDITGAPIIFIGMKAFPAALHRVPQLEDRIAHWVNFEPGDLADTRLMAKELCEVEILDNLVRRIHEQTNGSARGVQIALERLEALARSRNKRSLGLEEVPAKFDLTYGAAMRERATTPKTAKSVAPATPLAAVTA